MTVAAPHREHCSRSVYVLHSGQRFMRDRILNLTHSFRMNLPSPPWASMYLITFCAAFCISSSADL